MRGSDKMFAIGTLHDKPNGDEMIDSKRRKRKWLFLGIVGLFVPLAAYLVYVTHGVAWSLYIPIYRHFLDSIPTPPGLLPETVDTTLEIYHPCGGRTYDVDNEHIAIADFFVTEIPRAGWELMAHKSQTFETSSNAYIEKDEMLFTNQRQYWLSVRVRTDVDTEGVRLDNSWVHLTVCRNTERYYILGGSPESE